MATKKQNKKVMNLDLILSGLFIALSLIFFTSLSTILMKYFFTISYLILGVWFFVRGFNE